MKATIIRVIGGADGRSTPHDGRYVVSWNPHTEYGALELTSTDDPAKAKRFAFAEAFGEYRTVSQRQFLRPDGGINRPLTGITVEFCPVGEP